MRCIGIDTGSTGVICELDVYEKTARYLKIPYRDDGIINGFKIDQTFEGFANVHKIVIEKVQGRGGWGATQCFSMGKNFGMLLGLLHHVPLTFVQPPTWQKRIHKGVKGVTAKDKSFSVFASLNPSFPFELNKTNKVHTGIIDAFFIARWALDEARIIYQDDWTFIDLEDEQ
jgi:hypothetical protein